MGKNKLLLLVVMSSALLWAACGRDPIPTPTPTETVSLGYSGPMIGSIGQDAEEDACAEDTACQIALPAPHPLPDAPLALIEQQVGDFRLGIPVGYSPLLLPDEVLVTAISADAPGGYAFSVRWVADDAHLAQLIARFGAPDFAQGTPVQSSDLRGHWLVIEGYGALALLTGADGNQVLVEALAQPEAWDAFEATFLAMLTSLATR